MSVEHLKQAMKLAAKMETNDPSVGGTQNKDHPDPVPAEGFSSGVVTETKHEYHTLDEILANVEKMRSSEKSTLHGLFTNGQHSPVRKGSATLSELVKRVK